MPISSLESYLFERKLANTGSIEILTNSVIGIDVEHYLSRIYTYKKEQALPAIGGIPTSLRDYIKSDLQVFQEFNIKPIFVVSGLNIQLQSKNYKTNELSGHEQHVENVWKRLVSKDPSQLHHSHNAIIENFRMFNEPLQIRKLINDIIKIFLEFKIDYLVTPYDASFQLSYLYNNKTIDIIYGSTDLLLTRIDKFILGMEFQSKDFRFINKYKVLQELNLNERQFLDLCLIVGCNLQPETFPIFPPIPKPNPLQPYPQLSYFKIGLDMLYQYSQFSNDTSSLLGYIMSLNNNRLLELYYKGVSALKYVPVINQEGYVELYNVAMSKLGITNNIDFLDEEEEEDDEEEEVPKVAGDDKTPAKGESGAPPTRSVKIPNDIHDIISQRLPPELYFYQSIGLLPLELLESITRGQLDVRPPLEVALADSYKKLVTARSYQDLLDYQYNLITQLLARYYQVKKIRVKYWFKDDVLELNNRLTPPIFKRIDKLFIQSDDSGDSFQLNNFFKTKLNGEFTSTKELKTREDVISTVLLRALYLHGILNDKNELSSVAKILIKFANEVDTVEKEEFEQFTLLLLLLQSKTLVLNEPSKEFTDVSNYYKQWSADQGQVPPPPPAPQYKKEGISADELKKITLISRIFSFNKFNISPINYQGPLSRSLLSFRSHVEFLNKNLLNSLQVVLVDLIVHQEQNEIKLYASKEDWYNLVNNLPFFKSINNYLMGVVAEIYFEVCLKQKQQASDEAQVKQNAMNHLSDFVFQVNLPTFNINVHGTNAIAKDQLAQDFKRSVAFWNNFVALSEIANGVDKNLVSDKFLGEIKDTDEFLQKYV
ncbi:Protein MKT1 [Candida viswanathii]|uniref:Protein MKT1 n=1 Tax=Candida viswanathii TaxID=5486 RepID=A0A367YA47_9ASCO|nr:Protein MKT1 [Candida viswanathii]